MDLILGHGRDLKLHVEELYRRDKDKKNGFALILIIKINNRLADL